MTFPIEIHDDIHDDVVYRVLPGTRALSAFPADRAGRRAEPRDGHRGDGLDGGRGDGGPTGRSPPSPAHPGPFRPCEATGTWPATRRRRLIVRARRHPLGTVVRAGRLSCPDTERNLRRQSPRDRLRACSPTRSTFHQGVRNRLRVYGRSLPLR